MKKLLVAMGFLLISVAFNPATFAGSNKLNGNYVFQVADFLITNQVSWPVQQAQWQLRLSSSRYSRISRNHGTRFFKLCRKPRCIGNLNVLGGRSPGLFWRDVRPYGHWVPFSRKTLDIFCSGSGHPHICCAGPEGQATSQINADRFFPTPPEVDHLPLS